MNPRPVSYLQTDPRWGALDYSARGEKTNIAVSGCGPTALAMVLATWVDPKITPKSECAWALAHGYKAPHQGTYYGYFAPAAKRFGLTCKMLNGVTLYGKPDSPYHAQAKAAVDRGDLVIACMGRGLWTCFRPFRVGLEHQRQRRVDQRPGQHPRRPYPGRLQCIQAPSEVLFRGAAPGCQASAHPQAKGGGRRHGL